jgi:CheY-like chemotaxis protein
VVVRVKCESRDSDTAQLHFAVRDSGIGIPSENLSSIFEAFSQVDSSTTKKFGGTGLGLAICARLVRLMDGRIWAESQVGQGSEFHFTVKFRLGEAAAYAPADSERASQPYSERAAIGSSPFRALVAEDNPANRMLARLTLERAGFHVTEAENGAEALGAVSRSYFDIVLMDCRMPAMDGYTATARIRSLGGRAGQVPVIALTASAFKEDRAAAEQAGMDDFVAKPFQPGELTSKCMAWAKANRRLATSIPSVKAANAEEQPEAEQYSPNFIREVFDIFLETSPPVFENLTRAIQEKNWTEARHCAHWLRSGAVGMLSPALEQQLGAFERACRNASPPEPRQEIASLRASFQSARKRAEFWCNRSLSSRASA